MHTVFQAKERSLASGFSLPAPQGAATSAAPERKTNAFATLADDALFADGDLSLDDAGAEKAGLEQRSLAAAETFADAAASAETTAALEGRGVRQSRAWRVASFMTSKWGIVTVLVALAVVALLLLLRRRPKPTEPPNAPHGAPHGEAPRGSTEKVLSVAWKSAASPSDNDQVIIFDVKAPTKAWRCCASKLFTDSNRAVRLRLPPGDYAARSIHRNGTQQVCSLDTVGNVTFTDDATSCTDATDPAAPFVSLGVCENVE